MSDSLREGLGASEQQGRKGLVEETGCRKNRDALVHFGGEGGQHEHWSWGPGGEQERDFSQERQPQGSLFLGRRR